MTYELGQALIDRKTKARYRVVEVGDNYAGLRPVEGGPRQYWSFANIHLYYMTEDEHAHITHASFAPKAAASGPMVHRGPDGAELGGEAG